MPQITALMSTYNSAHHVKETIDSIISQTYPDFEFLIIDDGSTDNTVEVIQQYNDQRIRLIQNKENKGVGACLNQALKLINTPYIAKVDSDDISHPERFAKQLQYMQQNPTLDIIKSYFEYFPDTPEVEQSERYKQYKAEKEKEHNAIDTPELIEENLLRWSCVIHATYFARSLAIINLGYPDYRVGEDYALFYSAVKKNNKVGCIRENLVRVRVSDYSTTTISDAAKFYSHSVVDIKINEIIKLHKTHGALWIYGTGGLGIESCRYLINLGFVVRGFLDRHMKPPILINGELLPVKDIKTQKTAGIIIAAQPVRMEIKTKLERRALIEHEDFLILA